MHFKDAWFRADAWCAAFVWPKLPGDLENGAITQDTWRRIEKDVSAGRQVTRKTVREQAREYLFLHWHLAFPQVFGEAKTRFEDDDTTGWTGGFDVMLGNPPWDQVQFREQEFFATGHPQIAQAKTGATRKRLVSALQTNEPNAFYEYVRAKGLVDGTRLFAGVFLRPRVFLDT